MKAVRVSRYGGAEEMKYETVPDPSPGPGELLIRLEVAGVNYIDTYHRSGQYPLPLPLIPGIEGVGTVESIGAEASGFERGDRVAFCLASGAYAQLAVVPSWKCVRLPEGVPAEFGAAAMCQGMTAHYLVTDCYRVQPGCSVLVHAAAGGVGSLLVQMAKRAGARVIGTASTPEKARLALERGADRIVRYTEEDFVEAVREFTGGAGVDAVYESVGKATFSKSLDCMKPRGFVVLYGQSSGAVEALDPQVLNRKGSLFLTRPSLGHYAANREEFTFRAEAVLNQVRSGDLEIVVGDRIPLAEAAEAHRRLEGRRTMGKVVLLVHQ